jgi:hypothetical protein
VVIQASIFDPVVAEIVTDRAVAEVGRHAQDNWIADMLDAVRSCCAHMERFTTDDVWQAFHDLGYSSATHETRAMGAVIRQAAKDGLCEATPDFGVSKRPEAHRCPKRIWRSLIFAPAVR